ncbi:MAG: C40 family peptidase [Candidatus Nanopelagicales bacterium]
MRNNTLARACLATSLSVAVAAPLVVASPAIAEPTQRTTVTVDTRAAAPAKTAAQLKKERKARILKRKIVKVKSQRKALVRQAKKRLRGRGQYVAGASSAWRFDCSGFTKYLYKKVLRKNIPHYSGAQMRKLKRVSKRNLKPGDLLFWGRGGSQHVSMYIGRGKMIGANNPNRDVVIESINAPWWRNKYAGAGTFSSIA